jgi:hypothetical protein
MERIIMRRRVYIRLDFFAFVSVNAMMKLWMNRVCNVRPVASFFR